MSSVGSKIMYSNGAKLTDEILNHNPNSGGVTVGLFGSKGSGKTTLLLTIAQTVTCTDPVTEEFQKETVVWRGRDNDYWNWIPAEKVQIFVHKADINTVIFKDDLLNEIPKSELPPIEAYTSIRQLHSRLRLGKINVVYEPTKYTLTDRIKKLVQKRGITGDELFKSNDVDPVIFWFEFLDWMVHNKDPRFITLIFDESDELIPQSPGGARWHLNLWVKDVFKELRRRRISVFLAAHAITDIDGRMKSKIQYKLWMKGSVTPNDSLINHQAPLLLEPGTYYIERTGWGMCHFNKIPEKPIILTYLTGQDERDDFGEGGGDDDDGGDGGNGGNGPDGGNTGRYYPSVSAIDESLFEDSEEDPLEKLTQPPPSTESDGLHIDESCLKRDKHGKIISIDFTKLSEHSQISLSQKTDKKKRNARKQPTYHRRSYILKRSEDNDDKRDRERDYDDKVKSGKIKEERLPKYDRNDNTTDEIDK